ncbi:IPT/TIG domain-containing protein [Xanthomonas albilineans]|uniref:IPT/TIG domain-containing protein n=1 Tax=Xanthomonas albilineans TaxID=29447 RepID=UPI00031905C6|nr:IPT/TIG domain-containing protein [Xanthomonas albilineans]
MERRLRERVVSVGKATQRIRWRVAGPLGVLIGLLLCSLCALATSYVYDAGGRLVAVSNDTSASGRYSYGNIGNLVAVDRIAGQLAIFAFSPGRGAPGTSVTIKGQGFSATASQNAVQFNGVAATVSTASNTELTVVVPSGATTGPIAITVGSATASSAVNFIVDAAAAGPTIDTVAPTLLAIGESVTVTGKGFLPVQGQTSTLLNARTVSPATLSNTTIVFPAPANVGSGKVTVTTPYGSATSAQDVVVVPAGIDKTQIESIKRLTLGAAPQPVGVTASGNSLAVLYDLTAGDYPSLQFSGLGGVSVSYTVYGPTNATLASGSVSARTPSVHLPRAPASGTYFVLLQPSQVPATWQLAVEKATPLDVNGASLIQPIIGAAQSKRFVFNAVKGQNLGLGLSDIVTQNATETSSISLQVFDSGSALVAYQYCYTTHISGCQLNIPNIQIGAYTVVVSPPSDGDQTMQFTATLSTDLIDSLPLNIAKAISLTRHGQNDRLSFTGKAGQEGLALSFSRVSTVPANSNVYFTVYAPDGSQVNSTMMGRYGGILNLPKLPADGVYTVFVDPYYGETVNATVFLSTPIKGTTPIDGVSGSYATTEPGQNVYLSFTAMAGQNLGFALSDMVTPNTTLQFYLQVLDSTSAVVANQYCFASNNGCQLNLSNLAGGTYTVVVSPPSDGDQTMQFTATLSADLADSLPLNTAKAISLTRRGQNARLSFSGTAGQQGPVLRVSGQSTAPANASVYYTVYAPDRSQVSAMAVGGVGNSSRTLNMPKLPADGIYTILVDPYYGETANATVMLSAPINGTAPIDGTPGSYVTTVPGQDVSLTFTATAGQNLGFALSDIVTPNSTSPIYVDVRDPNGNGVYGVYCYASYNGCQVNLSNLAGGTYTLVMSPPSDGDQTMQFTSALSADLTDSLSLNTAKAMSLTRRGQNARLSFSGKAGQQGLALQVSGQSTAPANANVYYTVYAPDGSQLNSMGLMGNGSGTLNLSKLPADGTYTVFVDPYLGETANATVLLSGPITDTTPVDGTPGSYATTVPGQNVSLSFTATAGQNLGFALSDIVTPNTTSSIYLQVSGPNGNAVASQYCYASNHGCQVNLSNLAAGTYTVVMSPPSDGDQTMQFTSTLSADFTDSLSLNTAKAMSLTRRGQNARLSFSGTAGQQGLALQVSGQTTAPAGAKVYYTVYAPDGSQLSSMLVTGSGSGTLNLSKLPADGTYTVFVDPYYGETTNATVLLSAPINGTTPIDGTPGSYATTVPGQNVYLSFTAMAGQNLGFALSDIVTPNATSPIYLQVRDPSGNTVASQYCYASSNGCQVNLSNLAGGTYTAGISPPSDGDQTMRFTSTLSADLADILPLNKAKALSLARRGQNARLNFSGKAGQLGMALQVSGQSTAPANAYVYYTVYAPDGSQLNSTVVTDSRSVTLNLSKLPADGTYTVFVDPYYGETASATILLSSPITDTAPIDGASGSYATSVPGQNVYLNFTAMAGQSLGLGLSSIVTPNTTSNMSMQVFDSVGNAVSRNQYCYAQNDGCQVNLPNLVGGTYTVVVVPPSDGDQTMRFTSTLSTDLNGTLTQGTAKAVSLTRRGQNARLSFKGTAGQALTLSASGQSTVPANGVVGYTVYAPDGSQLYGTWVSADTALNLPNLPADGTYTVFVDPSFGETINATVLLSQAITGTMPVDGNQGSYATAIAGRNVYLSFTASAGQNLGLGLSDIVTPNTTSKISLQVFDPAGNTVTNMPCYAANHGCDVNLSNLVGGAYTVVVSPPSDGDQTMKFTATLSADLVGSLTLGKVNAMSLTRPGQNARLSFTGVAGQMLEMQVSRQSTVPANGTVYYTVYAPDGSQLSSTEFDDSDETGTWSIPSLPSDGTYMIFVDPFNGATANANLSLSSPINAIAPVDGTSGSYATTMPGQNVYLSFNATAGQNLGMALSDIVTPNSTSPMYLSINDPNGAFVVYQSCLAANNGCQLNLTNLLGGTYTAVIYPPSDGDQTMKFTSTLSTDLTDSLVLGTAKSVSLTRRGQNARLSFNGTAGQQGLALQVSGQSTVPTARGVYYTVYAPDGSQLNSASITASGSVNLPKLPATGTYMVFVDPGYGETASASVLLSSSSSITGTVPVDGTSGSYTTTMSGQKVALSFTATAGQNLGFALSDIVTPNTTSNLSLQIADSAGNVVGSQTCAAANNGCQVNLSSLNAGTYSAVVSPPTNGNQTMKFTATLSSDLTDSLVLGTAKSVSLTRRGQNARLSFSGTAGQQGLTLQVSGQSTVPTARGVYYTVYAPDGSQLNSASITGSGSVNLSKLPTTGTYMVFVDPGYGETASASLLLSSASAITGTVPVNGTPGSYATTVPGQKVALSFTATAGQNLGFALSDIVTSNTTSTISLQIADSAGNALGSQTCAAANNGCQVNLSNLKASTYSVVLSPPSAGDQTMKFTATLSTDLTDSLVPGTAKAVSLTRRGQNSRLSFSGTAGQQGLALRVSGQSTVPASRTVDYTVYAPDGSQLNSQSVATNGTLNLSKLPATGTYTVFVDPHYGETASASVLLASAVTGTMTVNGTPGSSATTVPGQKVYLSFTATAGQNLGFALSDIVTSNTTSTMSLQIADPTGNAVGSQTCAAANNGCQVNLSNLKAGTYSVVLSPPPDGDQTMKFTSTLSTDLTDRLVLGTAKAVSLTRRGQNSRLSFSGTAGQGLVLRVSAQTTVPASRAVDYTVYAPDGTLLNTVSVSASGSLNLSKLPTTGTYTVFVDPHYGETISSQLLVGTSTRSQAKDISHANP